MLLHHKKSQKALKVLRFNDSSKSSRGKETISRARRKVNRVVKNSMTFDWLKKGIINIKNNKAFKYP
jgi:hypothetical protein